ncbi:hypothetical protein ACTXNC_13470, partial [Psychrobacter celer]
MKYIPLCLLSSVMLFSGCSEASNTIDNNNEEGSSMQKEIVIGDLGGVPVEIPTDSVRLVEYNG